MVEVKTTTARENEVLAMVFEKNRLIEQLAGEKHALQTENDKLREQLEQLKTGGD